MGLLQALLSQQPDWAPIPKTLQGHPVSQSIRLASLLAPSRPCRSVSPAHLRSSLSPTLPSLTMLPPRWPPSRPSRLCSQAFAQALFLYLGLCSVTPPCPGRGQALLARHSSERPPLTFRVTEGPL